MSEIGILTRAYIYGRQSQDSDASIDQQLKAGRTRAGAEGWQLAGEFHDGVSASRHSTRRRDHWPKLLAGVEAGQADVVWLWESSRGDRTLSSWAALLESCRDHGVKLCIETHAGRLYDMTVPREWRTMAEDGVDNAYESDKISQRVTRAMAANAVAGKVHGRVPYGYRREYEVTPAGKRIITGQPPHPAEAPVVRRIFAALAKGQSLRAVTAALNADQVPTRSGRPWDASSVRGIALNYAYIARRVHDPGRRGGGGHRLSPDAAIYPTEAWPPLVDEDVFYRVRGILTDPKRTTTRPGKAKHLLSMIARCAICAGPMVVTYRMWDDKRPAYSCRTHSCATVDKADLDQYVTEEVLARLAQPGEWERLTAASAAGDRELDGARGELAKIQAHYDGMVAELGARRMSPGAFAAAEPGVLADLAAAQARVKALEAPAPLRWLLDGPADLADRWEAAPVAARREVIRHLAGVAVGRSPVPGHRVPAGQRTAITWRV
ncbi:MAG TPA: recombinase family protein [Streptosporangiaceae bacterium]|nr:recombinase family protein [Streptosporangiaceae bacterium]